jgi:ribosomal protein S18 acetylase RimI-like enzyme
VVRRRAGAGPSGRPLATDVLGVLLTLGPDGDLTVRTEDGATHAVAGPDVVAAKRIGPRPARYSEIAALEHAADRAWPAPVHERLGDWYLRAAEGFTNRANSALPVGDPGRPLDAAIDACVAWYGGHGLVPRITVPLPLARPVAAALAGRGWFAQPRVLVQTAPLAPAEPDALAGVLLTATPTPELLASVAGRKAGLPASAVDLLAGRGPGRDPVEVRYAEVRAGDGTLLAHARGAVVGPWLHVALVETAPAARRRGLARLVSLALFAWGVGRGAGRAVLQVEEHNTAAVDLYAGLGFTTHHTYVTYADNPAPSAC